jgi:hypothetical protein
VNLSAVPQDIDLVTSAKSVPVGGESPKMDKPPSLQTEKTTLEPTKPRSPEDAQGPVNVENAPTSLTPFTSSHDVVLDSLRPEYAKCPGMFLWSPRSHGREAPGGSQPDEGSSMPRSREQPRPHSRIAESMWDNPDFIQAGFHIDWFVTASVSTKVEWENIKALYSSLETTSAQINVRT